MATERQEDPGKVEDRKEENLSCRLAVSKQFQNVSVVNGSDLALNFLVSANICDSGKCKTRKRYLFYRKQTVLGKLVLEFADPEYIA